MRHGIRQGIVVRRVPAGAAVATAFGTLCLTAVLIAAGASGAASSRAAGRLLISTAKSAKYGTILVSGHTVYTLKPSSLACGTTCLKYWPAVFLPTGVAHATAGAGVNAAKLGTVRRSGRLQVTYGGKALYWFFLDKANGQVKGNITDTWGVWRVVITKPLSSGTTTTTAGGGGGGGGGGF
ncbi:MAG TPA: hypothetical protein VGS61_03040 [Acidimicrobiales bacterium]|nr:hypothetical protein [Acidimicrobiales bacterium]